MDGGTDDQDRRPFAICAPGSRFLAELVLALHGEQVSEVRESRFLEGMSGVYVITLPDFGKFTPPFVFAPEPRMRMADVLRDRALAAAFMPPPPPIATLSSVI
jgi:hypothetical protein